MLKTTNRLLVALLVVSTIRLVHAIGMDVYDYVVDPDDDDV